MPRADDDVSAAVARLGSLTVFRHSLQSVVDEVADQVSAVLGSPGADVSVTVLTNGRGTTVSASSPQALALDETQYRSDTGPCLLSARAGRPVEMPDAATDGRWPEVAADMARQGRRSLRSHPLPGPEPVAGSLNVYAQPGALDADRWRLTGRVVAHAVTPIWNVLLYEEALRLAENLQIALDSRAVIEQAKGILMERYKIRAEQAFNAMARVSNHSNTKLRDLAQRVVDTGEFDVH